MKTRCLARIVVVTLAAATMTLPTPWARFVAGAARPHVKTLTAGGYDATPTPGGTSTMTAVSATIRPDRSKRVLVFVTVGSGGGRRVTAPALSGGRVTWRRVASVTRGNHLSRLEVLFAATGVKRGRLRFTFPTMKGWLAWSVVQARGHIVHVGTSISKSPSTGGRVTSLSVSLPARPAGLAIAGFTSGQTGDMLAVSPAATLSNGHSSYLTTESQFTRARSQSASWTQQAHAMAIVVELR
jgi:hypothetical protein